MHQHGADRDPPAIQGGHAAAFYTDGMAGRRGGVIAWEKPFRTGESNMSHTIANLEHHHFKYALFRRPGDIHVHFFGTATASFADGFETRGGDIFEIEAAPFTLPLRNRLECAPRHEPAMSVVPL